MRNHHWIKKSFAVALFATIAIAGFGNAIQHLWNWLMPQIFGLKVITFWQAVGLMSLSWLLFGGLRGFAPRRMGRRRRMSSEQKERLRAAFAHPHFG